MYRMVLFQTFGPIQALYMLWQIRLLELPPIMILGTLDVATTEPAVAAMKLTNSSVLCTRATKGRRFFSSHSLFINTTIEYRSKMYSKLA